MKLKNEQIALLIVGALLIGAFFMLFRGDPSAVNSLNLADPTVQSAIATWTALAP